MTSNPHQAGTAYDLESAEFVRKTLEEYGLDVTQLFDYDVLLDYPNDEQFNKCSIFFYSRLLNALILNQVNLLMLLLHSVQIKTSSGVPEQTYEIKEDDLGFENLKRIVKPFLAYTAKGSVTSVSSPASF